MMIIRLFTIAPHHVSFFRDASVAPQPNLIQFQLYNGSGPYSSSDTIDQWSDGCSDFGGHGVATNAGGEQAA
jgi:hypothetical protein